MAEVGRVLLAAPFCGCLANVTALAPTSAPDLSNILGPDFTAVDVLTIAVRRNEACESVLACQKTHLFVFFELRSTRSA